MSKRVNKEGDRQIVKQIASTDGDRPSPRRRHPFLHGNTLFNPAKFCHLAQGSYPISQTILEDTHG
ncbi:MAG: hypothetical protein HC851_22965 [Acaryochloris sp. RU_4_1]|nr:hypothetical protein [Acaryochloris sp. RU_4_1]